MSMGATGGQTYQAMLKCSVYYVELSLLTFFSQMPSEYWHRQPDTSDVIVDSPRTVPILVEH